MGISLTRLVVGTVFYHRHSTALRLLVTPTSGRTALSSLRSFGNYFLRDRYHAPAKVGKHPDAFAAPNL